MPPPAVQAPGLPEPRAPHSDIAVACVGIIMGSQSDWATMSHTSDTLTALGVPHETRIVSAHRTPDRLREYAVSARDRGLRVIIAGAGGAAHLPGMAAAWTSLPVLGVPVESHALKGMDSLLSIVQMPAGIPVATFAIGRAGAVNAALLAAAILATTDTALAHPIGRLAYPPDCFRGSRTHPQRDDRRTVRMPFLPLRRGRSSASGDRYPSSLGQSRGSLAARRTRSIARPRPFSDANPGSALGHR